MAAVQSTIFGSWFPWSLPIRAVMDGAAGQDRITAVALVGAALAATIGCGDLSEEKSAELTQPIENRDDTQIAQLRFCDRQTGDDRVGVMCEAEAVDAVS